MLLSNTMTEPPQMQDEYFGRTSIEAVFKTGKDFLSLLPLSKWSRQTVLGKLLSDTICTIVYLELLKTLKRNIHTETSRDNIIINVPEKGRWHNLR